jgi:hypothetical protein
MMRQDIMAGRCCRMVSHLIEAKKQSTRRARLPIPSSMAQLQWPNFLTPCPTLEKFHHHSIATIGTKL